MRTAAIALPLIFVAFACDDKPTATTTAATATATAATAPPPSATDSGPKPQASLNLPERPIPKPQSTVGAGMPIEVQQKAIAYMVAMRAPRPDDANSEPTYANDLATKLKPILLSMDTGGDKAKMNRIEVIANGRQIDLLMAGGCNDKTPFRAVVQRANEPLATLASHGVFVVRCNDEHVQCLQSTRDPDDVLCTTAPRHK
jgi:hypothetical protein